MVMVDPIDDITRQARQGSVSAIIQVLNEKLADSGIRTRAVFEQGVLQLLCEAATPQQLEQSVLVPQVRQILESLQPRRIRRVSINSRIVREQQLLWLDEINRDPKNQLLWSEEIVLRRPNFIQRVLQDRKQSKPIDLKASLPKGSPKRLARENRLFWRGLIGGASLSLFLLLVGWTIYSWLDRSAGQVQTATSNSPGQNSSVQTSQDSSSELDETPANPTPPAEDPFSKAVNLAQSSVEAGQTAKSSAEWLTLAAQWQQASELMNSVPPDDPRYATAQSRVVLYRQNSEAALQQAENNR
jgi:hypothetical protein